MSLFDFDLAALGFFSFLALTFVFFDFAGFAGLSFLSDFRLNTVALSNWCFTILGQ